MESFKIILIGDTCVGKSSLVIRLLYARYNANIMPTIGAAFSTTDIKINDNTYKLNIWDTAGQERYHSISKFYYKNAIGCIFVFDVSNRKSFDNIKFWLNDVSQNNNLDKYCRIIVANKIDINKDMWQVTEKEIISLANNYQCTYMFTSSPTGQGILELFSIMTRNIVLLNQCVDRPVNEHTDDNNNNNNNIVQIDSGSHSYIKNCGC